MDNKNTTPQPQQHPIPNPPAAPTPAAPVQPQITPVSPTYNPPLPPVTPLKIKKDNAAIKATTKNVIRYIAGFIEVILVIRFMFKLLGANGANSFVKLVYSVTNIFSGPFNNIFGTTHATLSSTHVFDPTIIIAGIVYALIAWGVIKLVNINHKY